MKISHKWLDNHCVCGCVRTGQGVTTRHTKDGVTAKYIPCTRTPIGTANAYYHKTKEHRIRAQRAGEYALKDRPSYQWGY